MKRGAALRHVTELTQEADRLARLPGDLAPPLSELWIGGDLLDGAEHVEWALIVVRLDVPADELPYLAPHPAAAACESLLRLDKRPIDARWRPRQVPAWDHEVRRVARVWSAQSGPDELLLRDLRTNTVSDAMIETPTPEALREYLTEALPQCDRHLGEVLDGYWEPDWRRAHRGGGIQPEHHLWRAAEAVRSMREALDGLA
ncbi:DUF7711 family protein [Nocardioides sp.]|uniref:DUF7711 family protein n=1 Tax=Nocardioides sp. TaxID=35761 RepID=UPI002EDB2288